MARLLVVDDEPTICWGLTRVAEQLGHETVVASSAEEAIDCAAKQGFEAVVLDVRLPGLDGLSAMPQLRKRLGDVPVIIITAFGDLDTAVDAVRGGAFEYLVKPFDLVTAERVLKRALSAGHDLGQATDQAGSAAREELIGRSPAMQEVFKRVALAAASDACVQIRGESGTGKELVARAIHRFSARADGPFVAVNVASLSETLAESELFGHQRGAFTGADQARVGLLEQAHGGTIFLDEVADIQPSLQVKLLRALDQGEILPIGSTQPRLIDLRVISATHQDLGRAVAEGRFRHDLFFRLNTFPISLPALRERRTDIDELIAYFLRRLSPADRTHLPQISNEALANLRERYWSGNVRELRNVIEHGMILARGGRIGVEHLPAPTTVMTGTPTSAEQVSAAVRDWAVRQWSADAAPSDLYDRMLELVEPPLFQVALEHNSGQQAAAARNLGLHRITLRKRLGELGLR